MQGTECDRQRDVLHAIRAGRLDEDLREHAATCASCADLVIVANALVDNRLATMRNATVPGSGLVWWRMQMRARQDAVRTATRTMTLVQGAVVGFALIVAFLLLRSSGGWDALSFVSLTQWTVPLVLALSVWLALAPVAVYLAVTED